VNENQYIWYGIYLLTAIGLSASSSSTVHIYAKTIHRTTQITTKLEECGPCPIFASFNLEFALQLRKKHGKTLVWVRKISVRVQCTYYQNTHTLQNLQTHTNTHTHITKSTHTHTHTHTQTHTHTHIHTHTHTLTPKHSSLSSS
jgi:hypothetical protein